MTLPLDPSSFLTGAELPVDLDVEAIVRRGRRRKRAIPGAITTVALVVLVVAVLAASGLIAARSPKDRPLASATGLFPQRLFANNIFGGPKNHRPVQLVAAAAQVPGKQSLTWTVPGGRAGSEWFIAYCTTGRVTSQIGGTEGNRCRGLTGLIGGPVADPHRETITVRVSTPQTGRWGVAVYQGR